MVKARSNPESRGGPGTKTRALPLKEQSLPVEESHRAPRLVPVFPSALGLGSFPQVQSSLWSTKLSNVLISAATAAGGQEDRGRLPEGDAGSTIRPVSTI